MNAKLIDLSALPAHRGLENENYIANFKLQCKNVELESCNMHTNFSESNSL